LDKETVLFILPNLVRAESYLIMAGAIGDPKHKEYLRECALKEIESLIKYCREWMEEG